MFERNEEPFAGTLLEVKKERRRRRRRSGGEERRRLRGVWE